MSSHSEIRSGTRVNGAAMEQSPSPSFATICMRIHEIKSVPELERLEVLLNYYRYIDDIFQVWAPRTQKNRQ